MPRDRLFIAIAFGLSVSAAQASEPQTLERGQSIDVALEHELAPRRGDTTNWITTATLTHDGSELKVVVEAKDPEPDRIVADRAVRDRGTGDLIELLVDPRGDGVRAFSFSINAEGAVNDRISSSRGDASPEWNGEWTGEAERTADGYRATFRIPMSTLGVAPDDAGRVKAAFAIQRAVGRGRYEVVGWPRVDLLAPCVECQYRRIDLEAVEAPKAAWRFIPYAAWTQARRYAVPSGAELARQDATDVGIDVRYTPGEDTNVLATLNPDFSQVELDSLQIAVNRRFALSFPERRPFFTENAGRFTSALGLLYTRTLVDPDWGVQGVHRTGDTQWAAMAVEDAVTSLIVPGLDGSRIVSLPTQSRNLALRSATSVAEGLRLGTLATWRDADGYANRVAAVDARFERGPHVLQLDAAASRTTNPLALQASFGRDARETGHAWSLTHDMTLERYASYTTLTERTEGFRADLGRINRVDVQDVSHVSLYRVDRDPEAHRLTAITGSASVVAQQQIGGGLLTSSTSAGFSLEWRSGHALDVSTRRGREVVEGLSLKTSDTSMSLTVPVTDRIGLLTNLQSGKGVDFSTGEGGRLTGGGFGVSASYAIFRASLSTNAERLVIAGNERYRALIGTARLTITPSTRHQVTAILTASDSREGGFPSSRAVAGQLSYRYQPSAFTALNVGVSSNGLDSEFTRGLQKTRTFAFAKVSYQF